MFCSNCGATIADDTRFCPTCGAAATTGTAPAPPSALKRERPGVITLLAVLDIVGAVMWALIGLGWFALSRDASVGMVGVILGSISLVVGLTLAFCAYGLWNLKRWGRALQIALSIFGLLAFPIGTLISILVLVFMFQPGIKVLFSERPVESLSADETAHLRKLAQSQMAMVITVVIGVGFVAIPIAGIIAAIAIPNLLNAVDRGKQKRTMADTKSIATAVEAFRVDHNAYPVADTVEELAAQLSPYLKNVPKVDGWSHPFQVASRADGYLIYSFGKDGQGSNCDDGQTQSFNEEICYADGDFVRYPLGTQQ